MCMFPSLSSLHTSKRMHFIEDATSVILGSVSITCIRQNVCTSLRTQYLDSDIRRAGYLHTSKRMHFIEETCRCIASRWTVSCIRQNVCTSLRT